MSDVSLKVLRYCAEEVDRQHDHAEAVFWMVQAWQQAQSDWLGAGLLDLTDAEWFADRKQRALTVDWIERWGILVQPEHNSHCDGRGPGGFRTGAVYVGTRRCPEASMLPRLMKSLVEAINERRLDADRAYYEFEMIHPFFDGNGRTGKILYNYILGTLHDPKMPPNFFGCSNP